jgi:alkylated DNA nucleotide flippase Atl1
MLNKRISAQLVGWQLSGMDESERWSLPRWRVVNRKWEITSLKLGNKGHIQKMMLEDDGILVYKYQVPMERYQVNQEIISF